MPPATEPLRMGIIGCGYWGPNVLRNFAAERGAEIAAVADLRRERLDLIGPRAPSARLTTEPQEIIEDPDIEAVAIATPVGTHFELARAALEAGKHVYVAKPLCATVEGADELVNLAAERDLVLLVDHTFVYTAAVREMKRLLDERHLGELWYFDSVRVNLGLFQHDVNVIWDLAAHDFSILLYLLDGVLPNTVRAVGAAHSRSGLEDVAYVTLEYDNSFIAHCHVNWLSPVKVRQTLIGGSERMLVWNDIAPDEKLRVYDKGISLAADEAKVHEQIVSYRTGDAWIPALDGREALALEAEHFVSCVRHRTAPTTGGRAGREVVRMLEATSQSLRDGGLPVDLAAMPLPELT